MRVSTRAWPGTCSSPPAGRDLIEGAHLLGDETGAAGSTRPSRVL